MKNFNKIVATMLAGAMLAGCADLDIEPQGNTVTSQQKEEVAGIDPAKSLASVTGLASMLTAYGSLTGGNGSTTHWDIGWPALFIWSDLRGMDEYSINSGYNWYNSGQRFTDVGQNSQGAYNPWGYGYDLIRAANNVVATLEPSVDYTVSTPEMNESRVYLAQGYAFRAMAYLRMVEVYQFSYAVAKDKVAVPIITNENAEEAANNGCALSTVEDVYKQIIADLDNAIKCLENNPVTPAKILDSKSNRFFSAAAAYGMRARAHLNMEKWAEAANDAQQAISLFAGAPLSMAEAGVPGFNTANAKNWMLGIVVAETDRVVTTGVCNFPSHMGSFAYGYATAVGAWKWINNKLYDALSGTDVRKGWWLNEAGESANLSAEQQAYVSSNSTPAYVQVKFAPYNNVVDNSVNASDIPLMRVEEMYLILAEAQAMTSPATGKATLENFVNTYRDPKYTCSGTTSEEVREAVYFQRRIELWGEGFSYGDMLRLNKDLDRRGGGWPKANTFFVKAGDPCLIYAIPLSEVQTNPLISNTNDGKSPNGGGGKTPEPVTGE